MVLFRPSKWDEFIGNDNIRERLKIQIGVHIKNNTMLPHIILSGQPGCGKTTLANIISHQFKSELIKMTGGSLKNPENMIILLRQIGKLQIKNKKVLLFIDEVHDLIKARLPESAWLPLFEDFVFYNSLRGQILMDPETGEEFEVRSNMIRLHPFTIIGATTNFEKLSKSLRDRFSMSCEMEEYTTSEMELIVKQYTKKRKFGMGKPVMMITATRSRFNPRTTISLVESCIIRSMSCNSKIITNDIFHDECRAQKIDNLGLGVMDRKALMILSGVYPRGMGISRLSSQLSMQSRGFAELHEGYLETIGLIKACSKGRMITQEGIEHLKNHTF